MQTFVPVTQIAVKNSSKEKNIGRPVADCRMKNILQNTFPLWSLHPSSQGRMNIEGTLKPTSGGYF